MRRTIRGSVAFAALLCGTMFLAACTKNGTGDTAVTPSENTPAVSVSEAPSPEITPTATPTVSPTPTVTPTSAPTPTPTVAYGSVEQLRRNRELHEIVSPKRELAQTGTAPALTEQDQSDVAYGIARVNPLGTTELDLLTGGKPRYGSDFESLSPIQTVHFSGFADTAVCDKINNRIDEIVSAMADPNYLPDVSGIYTILKERGLPKVEVYVESYAANKTNGIQSVTVHGRWIWTEKGLFSDSGAAMQYQMEHWPADDGVFMSSVGWEYVNDQSETMAAVFNYYINQTVGLTFNLATGEEMQLSDFFPEGEDYLRYLNEAITESLRTNDYWFSDYDYRENGVIHAPFSLAYVDDLEFSDYQDKSEYDGRSAFSGLTGSESFYLYENKVYFPQLFGREIHVELPTAVPDPCRGKNIFANPAEWRFASLGNMQMCDMEYSYAVQGPEMGSIRVPIDGKEQKIIVYKGSEEYPVWYHNYDEYLRSLENVCGRFYTDKEILEYVKQWFINEWPRECEIREKGGDYILKDFTPRSVIVTNIEVFPGGYAYVDLQVANHLKDEEDAYGNCYWASAWMKDGKYISGEEIFDVSYEELLTELFGSLCHEDGSKALTDNQTAEAAKLLAPYIITPGQEHEPSVQWSWSLLTFPWRMLYSGDEFEVNFPKDLRNQLPEALWKSLLQDAEVHEDLLLSDPYLYPRHMRMYEGYSFEQ